MTAQHEETRAGADELLKQNGGKERASNARRRPGRLRILVAGDEGIVAEDIAATVREAGAEVVGPADTLACALRMASQSGIDGALLSIRSIDDPVFSLADDLQARGVPFFFATELDKEEMHQRFRGTRTWLKPFDVEQMVRELIASCRSPS